MKIEDFISMESNRPNHLMLSVLTCICCEDISVGIVLRSGHCTQSTVNREMSINTGPGHLVQIFALVSAVHPYLESWRVWPCATKLADMIYR